MQQALPAEAQVSRSTPLYLFGSVFQAHESPYSHLLYLILSHPSFISKVNEYL